jgi:hypothetical protein
MGRHRTVFVIVRKKNECNPKIEQNPLPYDIMARGCEMLPLQK